MTELPPQPASGENLESITEPQRPQRTQSYEHFVYGSSARSVISVVSFLRNSLEGHKHRDPWFTPDFPGVVALSG